MLPVTWISLDKVMEEKDSTEPWTFRGPVFLMGVLVLIPFTQFVFGGVMFGWEEDEGVGSGGAPRLRSSSKFEGSSEGAYVSEGVYGGGG